MSKQILNIELKGFLKDEETGEIEIKGKVEGDANCPNHIAEMFRRDKGVRDVFFQAFGMALIDSADTEFIDNFFNGIKEQIKVNFKSKNN